MALLSGTHIGSYEIIAPIGSGGMSEVYRARDGKLGRDVALGPLPADAWSPLLYWSPDEYSVAYMANPTKANDPNAGLWVDDFKSPPRQIFRGWVVWFARGAGDEIYFLEGKPDLNGVLWKVGWNGQGLTRTAAAIPIPYDMNYEHEGLENQFDVSPDGQHVAFQTEQVLEENIGMIENVH